VFNTAFVGSAFAAMSRSFLRLAVCLLQELAVMPATRQGSPGPATPGHVGRVLKQPSCDGYLPACLTCAASAVFHKSPAVMAAALKFFLGQDAAAAGDDEDSDAEDGGEGEKGKTVVVAPTKEEVYKATHKVRLITSFCCIIDVLLLL
jgi:hypothetical protein